MRNDELRLWIERKLKTKFGARYGTVILTDFRRKFGSAYCSFTAFMLSIDNFQVGYFQAKNIPAAFEGYNYRVFKEHRYHVTEIIGFELQADDTIIERNHSGFGKIVTGGLLFGGLGAIAGAMNQGQSVKRTVKTEYIVRLLVNDLKQASIDISCDSKSIAIRILHTLALLEKKYIETQENNEVVSAEPVKIESNVQEDTLGLSYSDEIRKLHQLKTEGIINEEEYLTLKNRIINK
jgi:hypothetical protein